MPIKDASGEVLGVAQVINKLGPEQSFTESDEKVFAAYLQFCGIAMRNAQLYENSQLEVRRNQVRFFLLKVTISVLKNNIFIGNLKCIIIKIIMYYY